MTISPTSSPSSTSPLNGMHFQLYGVRRGSLLPRGATPEPNPDQVRFHEGIEIGEGELIMPELLTENVSPYETARPVPYRWIFPIAVVGGALAMIALAAYTILHRNPEHR